MPQSRTYGKPALFNRGQSTGSIGGKEMLELRSRQLGPIEHLLGLALPSVMSEVTLLHPDDREIVVIQVVQVRVLAATPDLRHMVLH